MSDRYRAEFDTIAPPDWYELVSEFGDANLYQLWQHGAGPERFTRVSRMVLRSGDEIVAAAETRLFEVPLLRRGIAYILWGPLVRKTGADASVFRHALRALREEYVERRRMILRLSPRLICEEDDSARRDLIEEGFTALDQSPSKRSLLVDVTPTLDELRRDFEKRWRNSLSKAERSNLTITSGTSLELFDAFVTVYERLLQRKQFAPSADIQKHRRVQLELPERLKMRIVLASRDGQPCGGAIYTALGDTAVYLFGATDQVGMQTSASYLVQWTILQELKDAGIKRYDLNGIDPIGNPGPYHFKVGLAGKKGMPVTFLGQYQAAAPTLANSSLLLLDNARRWAHTLKTSRALNAVRA